MVPCEQVVKRIVDRGHAGERRCAWNAVSGKVTEGVHRKIHETIGTQRVRNHLACAQYARQRPGYAGASEVISIVRHPPVNHKDGLARLERKDSTHLLSRGEMLCEGRSALQSGNLKNEVGYEPVLLIKAGVPPVELRVRLVEKYMRTGKELVARESISVLVDKTVAAVV